MIARRDGPGAWHHVMNRAVGRRAMFETDVQRRFFLSLVAHAAHEKLIAVHAYGILSTHFHLLVESLDGRLSAAMHKIESRYARAFNIHNDRDGPLVRNRFVSKRVLDDGYRALLVGYIDWNAVDAGLCQMPEDWPFGSAHHYLHHAHNGWLERSWVRDYVAARTQSGRFELRAYRELFLPTRRQRRFVTRRIEHPATRDDLPRLLRADDAAVRVWLAERATIADGTPARLPVAEASAVRWACARLTHEMRGRQIGSPRLQVKTTLLAGLLRELCRSSQREIAIRANVHRSSVGRLLRRHAELMRTVDDYAVLAAAATQDAILASAKGVKSDRVGFDALRYA